MQKEQQDHILDKVLEENGFVFEAGIVDKVLRLKVTVFESVQMKIICIGQIRNINEIEKLRNHFETLEEVLEFIKDPNNVKLSLDEMSVSLVTCIDQNIFEIAKIQLRKFEEKVDETLSLQDILSRCREKDEFSNVKIKESFEILVNEIILLKRSQQKIKKLESAYETFLGTFNINNDKIKKDQADVSQKQLVQMKKQVEKTNFSNIKQANDFQKMEKLMQGENVRIKEKNVRTEQKYRNEMNDFRKQINDMKTQSMKQNMNFQKLMKIENIKMRDKSSKFEAKYEYEVNEIKKEMQEMNQQSYSQSVNFKKLEKNVKQDAMNNDSAIKMKTDKLSKGITKINRFLNMNKDQKGSTNVNVNLNSSSSLQEKRKSPIMKLYRQNKSFNEFKFDGKTLTKVKYVEGDGYKQFVFFEKIGIVGQFRFYIKIVNSLNRQIGIGVIDYDDYEQNNFKLNNNNNDSYSAKDGYKYPECVFEGNGIFFNETVEVIVHRKNESIKWMVNGKQRASSNQGMLGISNRKLFPYVKLKHKGDTIEFLMG